MIGLLVLSKSPTPYSIDCIGAALVSQGMVRDVAPRRKRPGAARNLQGIRRMAEMAEGEWLMVNG